MERKTILTPDKTVVSGDILIDDRPIINGKAAWHCYIERIARVIFVILIIV